jgi:23S rRNA (cytidine1920-2'-O)/16S rRNA (cytidine1409-2'-O)-methyltransferase
MVSRGLAATRERARALILAGDVLVDGRPVTKAGASITESATIELKQPDHPWVGRGGVKLAHALDVFGLDVADCVALDIGASTGGFTDVMLARGARRVVALDVGTNQLDWKLRRDPRVVSMERVNARYLTPDDLPPDSRRFDLVTIDVSFISLTRVLPAVPALLAEDARIIALVKPQFEAGREDVGAGGIVRDPAVHARVLETVAREALRLGLTRLAVEPSPITGVEGNREFLMLLGRAR